MPAIMKDKLVFLLTLYNANGVNNSMSFGLDSVTSVNIV